MRLQDTMLRPEAKLNFRPNPEKLCFCLRGEKKSFLVHLKLYANLTTGQDAMSIMIFFSRFIQHEYTQASTGAK